MPFSILSSEFRTLDNEVVLHLGGREIQDNLDLSVLRRVIRTWSGRNIPSSQPYSAYRHVVRIDEPARGSVEIRPNRDIIKDDCPVRFEIAAHNESTVDVGIRRVDGNLPARFPVFRIDIKVLKSAATENQVAVDSSP